MSSPTRIFHFGWWNLHNCAHFDPNRTTDSQGRWPKTRQEYEAKRSRVRKALDEVFGAPLPDLIAVCEISRTAAGDLLNDLPPGYVLATAPKRPREDDFQLAVFHRDGIGLTVEPPLVPDRVSEGTRPMLALHLTLPGHVIRFILCHWTAMDASSSDTARRRLADALADDCYEFLVSMVPTPGVARHVVVLGDLNDEPMGYPFTESLVGVRDHASAHTTHWRDEAVRRVRLYNAAWRYLGEQSPHIGGPSPSHPIAGSYFHSRSGWQTFDHILLSCGLLTHTAPYFDEAQTRIVSADILVDGRGRPTPFEAGSIRGVSDHLPILGRLVLPGDRA